jgi:ComF family protein
VCAEDYAFPWNTLIGDLKFRSDVALGALLAERLAAALGRAASSTDVDLVLPIPLSAQRLQQRGFNQAWELARRLARLFGLQAEAHLLQRPVDTAHQLELSLQDRTRNLQGAFMVDPQARSTLLGRRVALVDDVMTTGATFRQATQALLRAGAGSVDVWAVARTP